MANVKNIVGALEIGTIIRSPHSEYKVLELLGAGGFGITYKVCRQSDQMVFALKEYFPNKLCERGDNDTMSYLRTNSETIETGMKDFITEAQRLDRQNISHPNIVSIDEVFKANNTAYYVMEFIDGLNLRQFISRRNHNRPMTEEQALSVMRPVLQAVATIHKNKLTHLDIKHENIVLTEESDGSYRPVLIDFGQAKHYDRKGNATSQLTNAGCSDGFAPQEQYMGLTQFTPQADVYALAATLLYLLTAKQPVKSSDMSKSIIVDMLGDTVTGRVKNAIIRGMMSARDERTPSVESFAMDLGIDISESNGDGNVTRLLNISPDGKAKRRKTYLVVSAAVIALLIGVGAIWNAAKPKITDIHEDTELIQGESSSDDLLVENSQTPKAEASDVVKAPDPKQENQVDMRNDEKAAQDKTSEVPDKSTQEPQPQPEQTQAVQATQSSPESTPSQENLSDDKLFEKATASGDWETVRKLADKGYKKAYLPLAKHYCSKSKTHNLADTYARKAKSAGIAGADDVISVLEGLGYYD